MIAVETVYVNHYMERLVAHAPLIAKNQMIVMTLAISTFQVNAPR